MRRALANLLLALWMAGIGAPLLQTQPDLPACCRADGKHHCAMHASGDGFHAAPCSLYPHGTALNLPAATAFGVQARSVVLPSSWQVLLPPHSPDVARPLADDTQQRGPPLA